MATGICQDSPRHEGCRGAGCRLKGPSHGTDCRSGRVRLLPCSLGLALRPLTRRRVTSALGAQEATKSRRSSVKERKAERLAMTTEACVAFASASAAYWDVVALYEEDRFSDPGDLKLLVELRSGHERLRELFAAEADDEVCGLALSLLVLVDRLIGLLE